MDKFSLYDFMSYFLPGVVGLLFLYKVYPPALAFNKYDDFINGLIFTVEAISIGLFVHSITFYLIQFKWYKWLTMRSVKSIVDANTTTIKPNVLDLQQQFNKTGIKEGKLFDEAYYFLEYNDKITPAKSFQSGYFFLRNMITLMMLIFLLCIGLYFYTNETILQQSYYKYGVFCMVGIPVFALAAHFYRTKMVERIFNTYFTALQNTK